MKTLYMETTNKEPEETAGEIQKFLKGYNLAKFMMDYEAGEISGVIFSISKGGREIPFKLPINHRPLWEMAQARQTKYIRSEAQARRVAWRQILRWIQSQMALIDTGMVELEEVFLPYMIIDTRKQITVFNQYQSNLPSLTHGKKSEE